MCCGQSLPAPQQAQVQNWHRLRATSVEVQLSNFSDTPQEYFGVDTNLSYGLRQSGDVFLMWQADALKDRQRITVLKQGDFMPAAYLRNQQRTSSASVRP